MFKVNNIMAVVLTFLSAGFVSATTFDGVYELTSGNNECQKGMIIGRSHNLYKQGEINEKVIEVRFVKSLTASRYWQNTDFGRFDDLSFVTHFRDQKYCSYYGPEERQKLFSYTYPESVPNGDCVTKETENEIRFQSHVREFGEAMQLQKLADSNTFVLKSKGYRMTGDCEYKRILTERLENVVQPPPKLVHPASQH